MRKFCPLCAQNPHRRCQPDNNFAAKHVESEPLSAACGATINICLSGTQSSNFAQASSLMGDAFPQSSSAPLSSEDLLLEVPVTFSVNCPCATCVCSVLHFQPYDFAVLYLSFHYPIRFKHNLQTLPELHIHAHNFLERHMAVYTAWVSASLLLQSAAPAAT